MAAPAEWWIAVSAEQLELVKAAQWREWPAACGPAQFATARAPAVADARNRLVPRDGVGHVVSVEVEGTFATAHSSGRIELSDLADFRAHLESVLMEQAEYRGPVADADFDSAEKALGVSMPQAWSSYLQGTWLRSGWLPSGTFLVLFPPGESARIAEAGNTSSTLPGSVVIGSDGSREQLVLDLRGAAPQVRLAEIACGGWEDAFLQAPSLEAFLASIEDGSFEFQFE